MSDQTGKLANGGMLEHVPLCDVCNKHRSHGNHQACSRARQERYRAIRETETVQQGEK